MVHYNDYADKNPFIEECEPSFAYMKLVQDDFCYLIDVRSKPEWTFVGIPDSKDMKNEVIFCEWAFYPSMDRNLNFEIEIFSKLNFDQTPRYTTDWYKSYYSGNKNNCLKTSELQIENYIKMINK